MNQTIWYISKYLVPKTYGSAGNRGYYLLEEFSKIGYKTIAITSNSNNHAKFEHFGSRVTYQEIGNIQFIWLKTINYTVSKSLKRVLSWIHFEINLILLNKKNLPKPDYIIISSLSLLTILNGIILKIRYRSKLIFEIRDIWPLSITEDGKFSKINPLILILSVIESIGYRFSDLIIGTMPNLKEHVHNKIKKAPPIQCIPMGYSNTFLDTQEKIEEEYLKAYFNPNNFNIVYAGSIGLTNYLNPIFEAAKLLKAYEKIKFIIIGDGSHKNFYKEKFSKETNIIFAPKIKKTKVLSVLNHADLLYFSTSNSMVWRYGQSLNKLVDYMLAGKPILASYSGYQSMINESKCGFFVPSNNARLLSKKIIELSDLPKHVLESYGIRAKEWILKHRLYATLASRYSDLLKGLD